MAKELPYFKFEPNQWENGNIQMLSRDEKGLFIDLCSMYWSRLGDVPLKLAIQKLCAGNATALNSLCDEHIIQIVDGNIFIKFLSEQLNEFEDTSKQNSKNALDGWKKRREQRVLKETNATALNSQCETDAIREDKIKEDKIKEDKIREAKEEKPPSAIIVSELSFKENAFNEFWNIYDKKQGLEDCKKKFLKLSKDVICKILEVVPIYINSTPDKQYRKSPKTWLNQECWNDEIIINSNEIKTISNGQFKPLFTAIRESDSSI